MDPPRAITPVRWAVALLIALLADAVSFVTSFSFLSKTRSLAVSIVLTMPAVLADQAPEKGQE